MMVQKKPGDPVSAPPHSDVQQRTSDVVFTAREEASASRARAADFSLDVESVLDQLIRLSCELPIADGDEAVVRAMVNGLADILPTCGVGICFVENPVIDRLVGAPGK